MTAPVFFLSSTTLADITPGSEVTLDGPEARHAIVVQRRRTGDLIDLVDGAGLRVSVRIRDIDNGTARAIVEAIHREDEPSVRLVLVQALAKGDRDERAISVATETGVDEIVPWQAERSIVVWRGDRAAKSRARWNAAVDAATKQSRRARRPVVHDEVDSTGLAAMVRTITAGGGAALVLHATAAERFADVPLPTTGKVLIAIGPEGGISDRELADLEAAGARPVRLGPHILRTSTAGPIAVAMAAERLGRWA